MNASDYRRQKEILTTMRKSLLDKLQTKKAIICERIYAGIASEEELCLFDDIQKEINKLKEDVDTKIRKYAKNGSG